jgi:PAS domain S-box-containing protein
MSPLRDVDLWLIDRLLVPASLHDAKGVFVHVNEAAERASGLSREELIGRHFTDPVLPEARKQVAEQFRVAVERGEPTDFETVFVDGSGQVRGVRAQHLPLRDGERVVGVLILAFGAFPPVGPVKPIAAHAEPRLTPRQREVLYLIASGLSTTETAEKLTVSSETVRNHLRGAFRELRVHTRIEAIAAARRFGLLAPPALDPTGVDPDDQ